MNCIIPDHVGTSTGSGVGDGVGTGVGLGVGSGSLPAFGSGVTSGGSVAG